MSMETKCVAIRLMLSDIDGVLTDGRLVYDNEGIESKAFHCRDGQGIRLWRDAGYPFGLITLRNSRIVQRRAAELEIDFLRQGVTNKLAAIETIAAELDLGLDAICYLGDDLPDVRVLGSVGLGVSVADGCQEAREAADYVTQLAGGQGAVRETIEMILRVQGRWEEVVGRYLGE